MQVYSLTTEDLEGTADAIKVAVLRDLVAEGLLGSEPAEAWAATHTPIVRRKAFFRTLTDLWKKTPDDASNVYWMVVAKKPQKAPDKPPQERHMELVRRWIDVHRPSGKDKVRPG